MKNLKKFFAFSIATAMVAGAVWAGTPAVKSLAATYKEGIRYWWNGQIGDECKYVEIEGTIPTGYVEVEYIGNDKFKTVSTSDITHGESSEGQNPGDSEITYHDELSFKNVYPEKGLTIKVGETIELVAEGAEKYSPKSYKYDWKVNPVSSDSDEPQEIIATVTDGKITGQAEGQGYVNLRIIQLSDNGEPLTDVAFAMCKLEVVPSDTKETTTEDESSKQNETPVDPTAPTSEAQAKQEQTPESIANYQNWLATYGGGDAAAAPVGVTAVSGEVGQPGSEAIVNTGTGEPVAMFQSNDTTNTLLAAPVGVVPSGTKIETVEAGKDTPAFKAVQNKLSRISRRGTVQKVYGIAGLNPDGSLMTLINGKAAMSMPMPTDITVPAGKSLKVYLIDDNGQTTKLDTAIDQGRVVFEIPKFGTFAFVVE